MSTGQEIFNSPWSFRTVNNDADGPGPWHEVIDSCGKEVCTQYNDEPDKARLISAAPDLLAASASGVERLADLPRYLRENGSKTLAKIVEEVLTAQHHAIAKATGKGSGPAWGGP